MQYWLQCRRALWLLLLPVLLGAASPTEYEVKLVYLYNFTKFVTWPETAFKSPDAPFNICLIGFEKQKQLESLLENKSARNHPIKLQLLKTLPVDEICHILFLTREIDKSQADAIVSRLSSPTLIVGESQDFARSLGAIGFVTDDHRRIRIEINLKQVKAHGLSIRAQLLEIARVIYRDEESS